MTKGELVQEVIARGYDYVEPSRIATFVERSYQAISARYMWPWREATTSGTAPLEISDLAQVLSVSDTTQEYMLRGVDRRWLTRFYPKLSETGIPLYWYLEDQTFKVFPASSDNIVIRYVRVVPKLAESDEPLIPPEWQYLIVDGAVVYCLKDDDERQEARELKADVDREVATEMMPALISRNSQTDELITRTGFYTDYL